MGCAGMAQPICFYYRLFRYTEQPCGLYRKRFAGRTGASISANSSVLRKMDHTPDAPGRSLHSHFLSAVLVFFCLMYSLGVMPMLRLKLRLKERMELKPDSKATFVISSPLSNCRQAFSIRRPLIKSGKLMLRRSVKTWDM